MATAKKPVPMCVVTINYQDFILPFSQGVRLVELMQTAIGCSRDFGCVDRHPRYVLGEQPIVELASLKHDQVAMPSDAPRLTHR